MQHSAGCQPYLMHTSLHLVSEALPVELLRVYIKSLSSKWLPN